MSTHSLSGVTPARRPTPSRWLLRLVETLLTWRERARSRRILAGLDDHTLRDVGLDRSAVSSEIDKPFWRG